jgi:hypothetical protein
LGKARDTLYSVSRALLYCPFFFTGKPFKYLRALVGFTGGQKPVRGNSMSGRCMAARPSVNKMRERKL